MSPRARTLFLLSGILGGGLMVLGVPAVAQSKASAGPTQGSSAPSLIGCAPASALGRKLYTRIYADRKLPAAKGSVLAFWDLVEASDPSCKELQKASRELTASGLTRENAEESGVFTIPSVAGGGGPLVIPRFPPAKIVIGGGGGTVHNRVDSLMKLREAGKTPVIPSGPGSGTK